jgi:hypothetical protein
VPAEFQATFDLRLTPHTDAKEFENTLLTWIEEAEAGETDSGRITYEFSCVTNALKTLTSKKCRMFE